MGAEVIVLPGSALAIAPQSASVPWRVWVQVGGGQLAALRDGWERASELASAPLYIRCTHARTQGAVARVILLHA